METLVHENQKEYYRVLQKADNAGDSTEFVEFMLSMIRNALKELSESQGKTGGQNVVINVAGNVVTNEDKVREFLRQDGKLTANVLALSLGLTQRQVQRILANLKEEQKIIRHGASKNGYWEVTE